MWDLLRDLLGISSIGYFAQFLADNRFEPQRAILRLMATPRAVREEQRLARSDYELDRQVIQVKEKETGEVKVIRLKKWRKHLIKKLTNKESAEYKNYTDHQRDYVLTLLNTPFFWRLIDMNAAVFYNKGSDWPVQLISDDNMVYLIEMRKKFTDGYFQSWDTDYMTCFVFYENFGNYFAKYETVVTHDYYSFEITIANPNGLLYSYKVKWLEKNRGRLIEGACDDIYEETRTTDQTKMLANYTYADYTAVCMRRSQDSKLRKSQREQRKSGEMNIIAKVPIHSVPTKLRPDVPPPIKINPQHFSVQRKQQPQKVIKSVPYGQTFVSNGTYQVQPQAQPQAQPSSILLIPVSQQQFQPQFIPQFQSLFMPQPQSNTMTFFQPQPQPQPQPQVIDNIRSIKIVKPEENKKHTNQARERASLMIKTVNAPNQSGKVIAKKRYYKPPLPPHEKKIEVEKAYVPSMPSSPDYDIGSLFNDEPLGAMPPPPPPLPMPPPPRVSTILHTGFTSALNVHNQRPHSNIVAAEMEKDALKAQENENRKENVDEQIIYSMQPGAITKKLNDEENRRLRMYTVEREEEEKAPVPRYSPKKVKEEKKKKRKVSDDDDDDGDNSKDESYDPDNDNGEDIEYSESEVVQENSEGDAIDEVGDDGNDIEEEEDDDE